MEEAGAPSASARPPAEGPAPSLAPLGGPWITEIQIPKASAFVVAPLGAREPRPVFVGVHGAGDRADWACSEWFSTLGAYAWIVCPKGSPAKEAGTSSWSSAEQIAGRADAAVAAIRERFGPYVDDGPRAYGGWSQGGTLAASVARANPGVYGAVVLVEVGHTSLDAAAVASGIVAGGAKRAVVCCASGPCRTFAARLTAAARSRDLEVRVADVGLRGHRFDGPVFRALGPLVAWSLEGDARWDGLGASVRARWPAEDAGP